VIEPLCAASDPAVSDPRYRRAIGFLRLPMFPQARAICAVFLMATSGFTRCAPACGLRHTAYITKGEKFRSQLAGGPGRTFRSGIRFLELARACILSRPASTADLGFDRGCSCG